MKKRKKWPSYEIVTARKAIAGNPSVRGNFHMKGSHAD